MRRVFAWLAGLWRSIAALPRLWLIERQLAGMLDGLAVCDDCGVVLHRTHGAIRFIAGPDTRTVLPYCRWCYQSHRAELIRHKRHERKAAHASTVS